MDVMIIIIIGYSLIMKEGQAWTTNHVHLTMHIVHCQVQCTCTHMHACTHSTPHISRPIYSQTLSKGGFSLGTMWTFLQGVWVSLEKF